jgi:hypothetical protein
MLELDLGENKKIVQGMNIEANERSVSRMGHEKIERKISFPKLQDQLSSRFDLTKASARLDGQPGNLEQYRKPDDAHTKAEQCKYLSIRPLLSAPLSFGSSLI